MNDGQREMALATLQRIPSRAFKEVRLQKLISYLRIGTADMAKLTAAVVTTGSKVHREVLLVCHTAGVLDEGHSGVVPLVKLRLGPPREAAFEAGKADGDLRGVDHDTLDWKGVDGLASEGVHRHLKVKVVLLKVPRRDGRAGGLVVSDHDVVAVCDEAVNMAAQHVAVIDVEGER